MLYIIAGIILIGLDFFTKQLVSRNMFLGESIPLIKNIFHLTYTENTGAAFSIFADKTLFLIIITSIIILIFLSYVIIKKPKSKAVLWSVTLIVSGAVGNLIDRILYGKVVDFFDFRAINFAIFNVADCFVCIGAVLLCIYVFFSDIKEKKDV